MDAVTYAHHLARANAARTPTRLAIGSIAAGTHLAAAATAGLAEMLERRFEVTLDNLAEIVDAALSPFVTIDSTQAAPRVVGGPVYDVSLGFAEASYAAIRDICGDHVRLTAEWGFSSFGGFLAKLLAVEGLLAPADTTPR